MVISSCFAQKGKEFKTDPDWADDNKRAMKYPENTYLIGFSEMYNAKNKNVNALLQEAREAAQDFLIKKVRVTIESETKTIITDNNGKANTDFEMAITATSDMDLALLKFNEHYNKKKNIAYAMAYVAKADVVSHNADKITKAITKVKGILESSAQFQQNGKKGEAQKKLLEANNSFEEIDDAKTYIGLMGKNVYQKHQPLFEEAKQLKLDYEDQYAKLFNYKSNSIEDVAYLLATTLKVQAGQKQDKVRLGNITFELTKMNSAFSRRLYSYLDDKLASAADFNVITDAPIGTKTYEKYLLEGTYWEEGDYLNVIVKMKDVISKKTAASANGKIAIATLTGLGINYKPENFEEAFSKQNEFKKDEVVSGALKLEVMTNKGKDNLIFEEGESLKLYVRTNRECYVRFVYHMADGSQVLLVDNYYINSALIGKYYELPYEFECAEPFGVEFLQANAQTEQFPPLNTHREYGYEFITDDFKEMIVATRGFKVKEKKVEKTESRLTITTFAK